MQHLKTLSTKQRKALYDACTILWLISDRMEDRQAALKLRDYLREKTMAKHNLCAFDKTVSEKKLEANPIRSSAQKYANS